MAFGHGAMLYAFKMSWALERFRLDEGRCRIQCWRSVRAGGQLEDILWGCAQRAARGREPAASIQSIRSHSQHVEKLRRISGSQFAVLFCILCVRRVWGVFGVGWGRVEAITRLRHGSAAADCAARLPAGAWQVFPRTSPRISTASSRRPCPCASTWRGTGRTAMPSSGSS
jgi:hypothetical protein